MELSFRVIQFAVLIQLPAFLLFSLGALNSQLGRLLAISAVYFAGFVLAQRNYKNGKEISALGLIAGTLLLTIGFWYALVTQRLM